MRARLVVLLALLLFGVAVADGEPRYDSREWHSIFDSEAARHKLSCPKGFEIDHVVALEETWRSGGADWPLHRRRAYVNDPLNWSCVPHALNRAKSGSTLAQWSGGGCILRKQIAVQTLTVKSKYALRIEPPEARAIRLAIGRSCAQIGPPVWCADPLRSVLFPAAHAFPFAAQRCTGLGR